MSEIGQIVDVSEAQALAKNIRRCFQLKDTEILEMSLNKFNSLFDEAAHTQIVAEIEQSHPAIASFADNIPLYKVATPRELINLETELYKVLSKADLLNKRDICRAAAIFMLLHSAYSPQESFKLTLEFLASVHLLRENSDGETIFTIKSRCSALSGKAHTTCGANIAGALSPLSEKSGIEYEPLGPQPPPSAQPTVILPSSLPLVPVQPTSVPQMVSVDPQSTSVAQLPQWKPPGAQQSTAPQVVVPTSFIPTIAPAAYAPYHQYSAPNNMHASSEEDHLNKLQQLETYSKLKANLICGAPTFNGKSDFDGFVACIHEYISEQPYMTEALRKGILKSSCHGIAQEYLATIPALASQTYDSLLFLLQQRFGKALLNKKLAFDALTQDHKESEQEFADRVQRGAIGTQRTNEEVINRFIVGLRDKHLAEKLQVLEYQSIPEVLSKIEKLQAVRPTNPSFQPPFKKFDKNERKNRDFSKANDRSKFNSNHKSGKFPDKGKSHQPPKKAHQVEQYDSDSSQSDSPLNNMIEIFSLSNTEYQNSVEEVLAARTDKPAPPKYNLRSTGGIAKPSDSSREQQDKRDSLCSVLFPNAQPNSAHESPAAVPDQPMQGSTPEPQEAPQPTPAPPEQALPLPPPVAQPEPTTIRRFRNERRTPPAPAFSPLYGEKASIGDYLALLCGKNELMQRLLIQELKNRYYELTTVKSKTTANASAVSVNPPRRSPLQYTLVKFSQGAVTVGACADTGAEVLVISTAVLDKAQVPYDWALLPEGYPIRGITQEPAKSRIFRTHLTFLHDESPLTINMVFCVIQSTDYRFLIGRDILTPLKYNISKAGLTLTNPKTAKITTFPYHSLSESSTNFIGTLFIADKAPECSCIRDFNCSESESEDSDESPSQPDSPILHTPRTNQINLTPENDHTPIGYTPTIYLFYPELPQSPSGRLLTPPPLPRTMSGRALAELTDREILRPIRIQQYPLANHARFEPRLLRYEVPHRYDPIPIEEILVHQPYVRDLYQPDSSSEISSPGSPPGMSLRWAQNPAQVVPNLSAPASQADSLPQPDDPTIQPTSTSSANTPAPLRTQTPATTPGSPPGMSLRWAQGPAQVVPNFYAPASQTETRFPAPTPMQAQILQDLYGSTSNNRTTTTPPSPRQNFHVPAPNVTGRVPSLTPTQISILRNFYAPAPNGNRSSVETPSTPTTTEVSQPTFDSPPGMSAQDCFFIEVVTPTPPPYTKPLAHVVLKGDIPDSLQSSPDFSDYLSLFPDSPESLQLQFIHYLHDRFGNPLPSITRQMIAHEQGAQDICDPDLIQFTHFERTPTISPLVTPCLVTKGDGSNTEGDLPINLHVISDLFNTEGDSTPVINTATVCFDEELLDYKSYLETPIH